MVKLFISNRAIVVLLLPFIIGSYMALGYFTNPFRSESIINLGFFGQIEAPSLLTASLSFLLVFLNAFLINYLFNKNEFYERNMYMPSLLYVVLMSFFHSFYTMDGLLLAHSLLILCALQLFRMKQNEDGRRPVFNAAFFAGLAAIVHPPIILILPLLFTMVWSIRPFVLRESLLLVAGFGVPLVYGGMYLKWTNSTIDLQLLKQMTDYENNQVHFLVTASIFLLMLILGGLGIQSRLRKSSIRFKKLVRILWLYLLLGVVFGLSDFLLFGQIERFSFLLIPIPFFLSYAFTHKSYAGVSSFLFYCALVYSYLKFFI